MRISASLLKPADVAVWVEAFGYLENDRRIPAAASSQAFVASSINPNDPLKPCVIPAYSV